MSHQAPRGRHRQPPDRHDQHGAQAQGPYSPLGQYPSPGEYPPPGRYGTPYGGYQQDHHGQPYCDFQQAASAQPPEGPLRKKYGLRKWLIIAAAVFAGIIAAIAAIGIGHATGPAESWYAAGKAFVVAADQKYPVPLIGPVSGLTKVCDEYLEETTPVVPGQRPSTADTEADRQWLRGCEAGYYQDHPHQLVENGMMYPPGTRPCTGQCASNWYAAGKAVALAASTSSGPYLSPSSGDAPESAETWCADLLFPAPGQPLPASVEALLQGSLPAAGPESVEWENGCEAEYNAAQNAATPTPTATVITVITSNTHGYSQGYALGMKADPGPYGGPQEWCDVYADPDYAYAPDNGQDTNPQDDPAVVGCLAALHARGFQ